VLTNFASGKTARYENSPRRRADLFRISLPFDHAQQLLSAILAPLPANEVSLEHTAATGRLLDVCVSTEVTQVCV